MAVNEDLRFAGLDPSLKLTGPRISPTAFVIKVKGSEWRMGWMKSTREVLRKLAEQARREIADQPEWMHTPPTEPVALRQRKGNSAVRRRKAA